MMFDRVRMQRVSALFVAAAFVVACGGGGGGAADAPAAPPAATPAPPPPPASPAPPPAPATAQLALLAGTMGGAGNLGGGIDVARFERPASVAVDAQGNHYVADSANHTIRKISADGTLVSTFAGRAGEAGDDDGIGGEARFNKPTGLAIDSLFLYVADTGNRMVRRIRLQNADVRTLAGNPQPDARIVAIDGSAGRLGVARFADPVALALGPQALGSPVFVADRGTLRMIAGASVSTIAGALNTQDCAIDIPTAPVAANTVLCRPTGLAFRSADGRLYMTDAGRHVVRAIVFGTSGFATAQGNRIEFVAGSPIRLTGAQDGVGAAATFDFPDSIAATGDGELIVGQLAALRRIRISSEGARVDILAGSKTREIGNVDGSRADARFGRVLSGVAIDAGAVVIADRTNHLIRRFDLVSQQVGTVAGQRGSFGNDDGVAQEARFFVPHGLDIASDGTAVVVDSDANRARRIDLASKQVSTLAELPIDASPVGVLASDARTTLVGTGDHSLRVIGGGAARLLAGSGVVDGDGFADGDGTLARFHNPSAIAGDAAGVVFVADSLNHRIRAVAPDGTTSTFAGTSERGHVDGPIASARFDEPIGIARAASGELYVLEAGNRAIRKIAKDARGIDVVSTVAQRLLDPRGLAVDEAGNLYVIDGTEHTVRRFTPGAAQGEVIAGTPNQCGFVPGDLPGVICRPRGIAVRDGRMLLTMDQGVLLVEPLPQ